MSEKEKQLPSSPEPQELGIEKPKAEPEKGVDCLKAHEDIKAIQDDVRREIKDVDYWNAKREEVLRKNGFPRHALKETKIMAVLEMDENGVSDPDLVLMYNETGKLEDMLGYEPFKGEEGFEEVCRKTAGYYKERLENRIKALDYHISGLRERIQEQIGREWIHKPQECPGTYIFEEGKGYVTPGVREALQKIEVQFLMASLHKRLCEQKLLPENMEKEAVGLDYLQVYEANDGEKIYIIDQLDHDMKKSGEFREEDNHWVITTPRER